MAGQVLQAHLDTLAYWMEDARGAGVAFTSAARGQRVFHPFGGTVYELTGDARTDGVEALRGLDGEVRGNAIWVSGDRGGRGFVGTR